MAGMFTPTDAGLPFLTRPCRATAEMYGATWANGSKIWVEKKYHPSNNICSGLARGYNKCPDTWTIKPIWQPSQRPCFAWDQFTMCLAVWFAHDGTLLFPEIRNLCLERLNLSCAAAPDWNIAWASAFLSQCEHGGIWIQTNCTACHRASPASL
jgi:hypothetical protein